MAQQINLFNPIFLQQKKHFSAVTMLQALGLLFAGIVVFYGYALFETRALTRVAEDSRRQLQTQSEQVAKLTREFSPQGRSKALQDELTRAAAQLKQREDLIAMLSTGALGNTEGFARYLSALARQNLAGVWLTGFNVSGDEVELRLSGRVLYPDLVPAYVRALNREEVMRGRRIAEMRLTAREERAAPVTAAPGASAADSAAAAAKPPAAPQRYVEFEITAVRGGATSAPAAAEAKGVN
jgi:Tfp pilus assembly protein PilN